LGRGTSGALLAPVSSDEGAADATDHRLVAKVRRGDDRAFELLYHRYHRRIHAYILGMVKDHGRAEDVTQEVFVSALRRMRATERPIAFKPWIYEIAKNACIDAFRRSKRAEEVSYDADDSLAPADRTRMTWFGPTPDAAVAAKHDLESLCGAFGGLSETHHEILVLRELEGLSYAEIGRRMGMSRPAVESTLFRARRRLTEEYDDIVSGARCLRIQNIIQIAAQSRLGTRDTRRLARHLAHCQPCRREALEAGLDRSLIARPTVRERVSTRVAALLPFPVLARIRKGADASPPSARGAGLVRHLPMVSDQLSGGWGKLAAAGALLVAGVGAGVGVHHVATAPERPAASSSARDHAASAGAGHAAAKTREAAVTLPSSSAAGTASRAAKAHDAGRRAATTARRSGGGSGAGSGSTAPASAGGGATPVAAAGSGGGTTEAVRSIRRRARAALPTAGADPVQAVRETTRSATDTVTGTVHQTTGAVDQAAQTVTGAGPVTDGVHQVTGAVDDTTNAGAGAVNQAVEGVAGG
jgi:RNA polymerase sigma factor (sigma-70 family)